MLKQYKCNWPNCGYEFEREANVYVQIKCPKCGNYLKT